jgi:LysR family transcriptional regulator, transcriptional activator of nhaA
MDWINYHHLLYFHTIAREGSIAKACKQLHLTQPTLSSQLRALEEYLGEKLFLRSGRSLVLTEIGRLVYRYAEEIFTLGRELTDTLKGRPIGRPVRFRVGIADAMPKLIAYRLLEPALRLEPPVHLVCREGKPSQLLAELVMHRLDLVLADIPAGSDIKVRAYNHLLGECDIAIFGAPPLAERYRKKFPASLEGAPFLMPTPGSNLRRMLDQWFEEHAIRPRLAGEMEDSALLKVFGGSAAGLFAAPFAIAKDIQRQYGARPIGKLEGVKERYYAISVERKLKNPAVLAISGSARSKLLV